MFQLHDLLNSLQRLAMEGYKNQGKNIHPWCLMELVVILFSQMVIEGARTHADQGLKHDTF